MTENSSKHVLRILGALGLMFVFPYLGAFIRYKGDFPKTMFNYPAIEPEAKASFNPLLFGILCIFLIALITLYLYPRLVGFKKVTIPNTKKEIKNTPFPKWFWIGLVLWCLSLFLLWGHHIGLTWFFKFIDITLWWSFSLVLDGIVYKRTGGKSLLSTSHREIIGIAFASVMGWMIFEYFNFFVNDNWYYPNGNQIPAAEFLCYSMLASTAVFPISFEWFSLFNTFPKFKLKYTQGPKLVFPRWLKTTLVVLGYASMFAISYFPDELFFMVWIAPLAIFSVVLDDLDIWTPFSSLKKGNWSPLLLIALSWVSAGLCVECWNYFSGTHIDGILKSYNTLYWAYSVPYVNEPHLFEMPLLGYMGYLPYGVYAGIWWITFAYLLNIPTQFSEHGHQNV